MNSKEALEYLKARDHYITTLGHIAGVLGWDMETVMPEGAVEGRVEQFSLISQLAHEAETEEKLREAVEAIETEGLSDADKALVRTWKKNIRNSLATPLSLVKALSEETGRAHGLWVEARAKDDFTVFQPVLEKLVDLTKEKAKCIGDGTYDTLLDEYEEGMSMAKVDTLFDDLEEEIHSIMDRREGLETDNSFLLQSYDQKALESFCNYLADEMGFDRKRGATGVVAHPFTTNLGPDDIRISNRFTDPSIMDPISSIVHETGHALYEQYANLNPETRGSSLAQGTSMGIHESQSRFWENLMGRSMPFWEHYLPVLKTYIPSLEGVSLEDFVKGVNKTTPSAIRVNADELTYSLHIILRYRIEKALFTGALSVKDVPEAWNQASEKIIRYKVKNNSEGCLQDSHWSGGMFGYFPTYALGNLYGAMFLDTMYKDLGGKEKVDDALRSGNLSLVTEWQNRNIWTHGAVYTPSELVVKVCGRELEAGPFKAYLQSKY